MKKFIRNLLHKELSYQIHGAAIEVRKDFGPGHKEQLYQKAFEEELKRKKINFERQKAIKIFSPKDGKFIGLYRPDFVIDDKIIIEIKAEKFISQQETKRIYDYLRNSEYELAYFINFASPRLYTKRIILTNDRKPFYKKLVISLVSISLIFVFISGISGVKAQQEDISPRLSVSPHTFDLDFFPGETRNEKIKVSNFSQVAIPILARAIDFFIADESGGISFEETLEEPFISSWRWFNIENPNFILEPGESKEVSFTISVPQDAEIGGHYSVILFEPQLPSFYFKEGRPRAIPVIGVLFLLSVKTLSLEPETGESLQVVEFSLPKEGRILVLENFLYRALGSIAQAAEFNIFEKAPTNFILRIKNNDIYHIKPYGKILIYNLFGKKIGEMGVPQKTIMPGKIRSFPVKFLPPAEISEKLKWLPASLSDFLIENFFVGRYRAKLVLEAKSPLSAEIIQSNPVILIFFSLPWKFWLPFVVILAFLVFFIIKFRKRIKSALQILFSLRTPK